jgi:hypothetical protein
MVVLIAILLLLIATVGIVSTGPGFTLFGGLGLGMRIPADCSERLQKKPTSPSAC